MTIAVVTSQASVFGVSGGTTAALDSTGSSLIVIGIWCLTSAGENISDSKGNTWTQLTSQTNLSISTVLYYCMNPVVGSGHTFSTTSHFVGVGVLCLSGTATSSVFDQQNGAAANASGNLATGSITPTQNNEICVTAFGTFNGAAPTTPTGYTSIANNATATAEGGGMAYKIQTTAGAENPTWNGTGSSQAAVIASFKAAVASVSTSNFFLFF